MFDWKILLIFILIFVSCAGNGRYYSESYSLPPPTINSGNQPDVYMDKTQGYQMPVYEIQEKQYQYKNQWRYIPPQPDQKPQPSAYINTQTGDSYLRLGNDENSWHVGPKGDTIMPFGDWKINQKGNTYVPFGNGYIDSKGTYFMPMN